MSQEADIAVIVDELRIIQQARGLTDEKMGALLGVTRGGWRLVRSGQRSLGISMVYYAARAFRADLLPTLLIFLLGIGHDSHDQRDMHARRAAERAPEELAG